MLGVTVRCQIPILILFASLLCGGKAPASLPKRVFTVDNFDQLSTVTRSGTYTVAGNTTTAADDVIELDTPTNAVAMPDFLRWRSFSPTNTSQNEAKLGYSN